MIVIERLICLVIGYIFGMFQTGYYYGRLKGIDIRTKGSGNPGATNALRVFGVKVGLFVFLMDFLKAVLALLVIRWIWKAGWIGAELNESFIQHVYYGYGGLGVSLGHNFPFYLHFKGGKAVSSMAGILFMMDWRLMAVCLSAFIIVVIITRYVSLGSVIAMALVFIGWVLMGTLGAWPDLSPAGLIESIILMFLLTGLSVLRHRANIGRLLAGTENKLGHSKKEEAAPEEGDGANG